GVEMGAELEDARGNALCGLWGKFLELEAFALFREVPAKLVIEGHDGLPVRKKGARACSASRPAFRQSEAPRRCIALICDYLGRSGPLSSVFRDIAQRMWMNASATTGGRLLS